jgi:sulfite exporter TauE/SafE
VSGEFGYAAAFLTGLLGAGHCLGMCSGLAGGVAVHQGWSKLVPVMTFHGSRIAVYVALGTLGAALGRTLVQTGLVGKLQGQFMILAGLVIMGLGLAVTGLLPWPTPRCGGPRRRRKTTVAPPETRARRAHTLTPALAGLCNGLVPCSLVFSVATRATATADPAQAALLMLVFGLGTVPVMGTVTALGGLIGHRARAQGRRLAGGIVVLLGAWTLYEGVIFYQVMRGLSD